MGQLRFTHAGPRQFSTFAYDQAWIEDPRAFAVQPTFALDAGPFHISGQPGNMRDALSGVFADAAPDSWGRRLLERAYGAGLSEFQYLTLSDDTCRQGALRFVDGAGQIIRGAADDAVPRLVDLQAITAISRAYEQGADISVEDMQALAGAGGSGGARPKANVREGEALWLAKFTSAHDQQPIERGRGRNSRSQRGPAAFARRRFGWSWRTHTVPRRSHPTLRSPRNRPYSLHLRSHSAWEDRNRTRCLHRDGRFHAGSRARSTG